MSIINSHGDKSVFEPEYCSGSNCVIACVCSSAALQLQKISATCFAKLGQFGEDCLIARILVEQEFKILIGEPHVSC